MSKIAVVYWSGTGNTKAMALSEYRAADSEMINSLSCCSR